MLEMRFSRALRVALIVLGVVVSSGFGPLAQATVIQTFQPTASSENDPVWGQGITINIGASLPDSLIPDDVLLDFAGFRTGVSTIGSPGRTAVYMHVYDDFSITAGGAVSTVGNLIGVSTNTVDLEAAAEETDVFWFFDQPTLAKDATYYYIMANDTVAATGSFSNLIYSDLRVGLLNPYLGGQHYAQTGDLGSGPTSSDLFFRVQSTIPEPSTFALAALGLLSLGIGAQRRRRSE